MRTKRRLNPTSRIRPWRNCTFSIQIEVEDDNWDHCKHVWIDLRREAPGRHGRLKLIHTTIPMRKRKEKSYKHFASPSYRLDRIRAATEVLHRAGVPAEQAKEFISQVAKVYPPPTQKDLYDQRLNDPLISMALEARRKDLSYYRTGKYEWTDQDVLLVENCLDDLLERTRKDRALMDRFSKLVLGPRSGDTGL